jgi:hypothetical protein
MPKDLLLGFGHSPCVAATTADGVTPRLRRGSMRSCIYRDRRDGDLDRKFEIDHVQRLV